MAVGFHVRPATGRVDHDRLDVRVLEGLDGGARQRPRPLGFARVGVERPAATLGARDRHLRPLPRETPDRRLVVRAEDRVLHAAVQQPHALASGAARGDHLGQRTSATRRRQRREERLRRREARRKEPEEAACPDEALEPAPLVGSKRRGDQTEQGRAGQQAVEGGAPHQPTERRPGALGFELGPPRLDEVAVGDPGRARALARPAAEAEGQVLGRGLAQRDPPVGQRLDQVDPAARRVGLLTELRVRRTARQAETAVDALQELAILELGEDAGPAGRGRPRGSSGRRRRHGPRASPARSRPRSGPD